MITRKEYMANSRELHHPYHAEIAKAAGVNINDPEQYREELARDRHLNTRPLLYWDRMAACHRAGISRELKLRGDFWSLASGVCTVKAAIRDALT